MQERERVSARSHLTAQEVLACVSQLGRKQGSREQETVSPCSYLIPLSGPRKQRPICAAAGDCIMAVSQRMTAGGPGKAAEKGM